MVRCFPKDIKFLILKYVLIDYMRSNKSFEQAKMIQKMGRYIPMDVLYDEFARYIHRKRWTDKFVGGRVLFKAYRALCKASRFNYCIKKLNTKYPFIIIDLIRAIYISRFPFEPKYIPPMIRGNENEYKILDMIFRIQLIKGGRDYVLQQDFCNKPVNLLMYVNYIDN